MSDAADSTIDVDSPGALADPQGRQHPAFEARMNNPNGRARFPARLNSRKLT
jgi:hypothetical protein